MFELQYFNLIMALVIAVVIMTISVVKNPTLKAIVYGLPIPITLALVASQKPVDESHVVGLCLLVLFLWMVHWMRKRGVNIFVADLVSALVYTALGFVLVKLQVGHGLFIQLAFAYLLLWVAWMLRKKGANEDDSVHQGNRVPLAAKGVLVFIIASLLLTLKDVLKGVIVTFPFSGVFAVVEMQGKLHTLASEFTKNSIAILMFLVIVHYAGFSLHMYGAILLGWVGYIATLSVVRKYLT